MVVLGHNPDSTGSRNSNLWTLGDTIRTAQQRSSDTSSNSYRRELGVRGI
jgi:hypothetical protein